MPTAKPSDSNQERGKWKDDPCLFIETVLRNPDGGTPFVLYPEERTFLRNAFALTKDGRLPFPELLFSAPKKSGKTCLGAMIAIYVAVVLSGQFGEVYCLANDFEQASSRVFQAAARIVQASPLLRDSATITGNRIVFRSTGTFIMACASDATGFAGGNPNLTICDELWGFTSESSRRLFDEAIPSPARKVSGRLTVTYAGFSGESDLLEGLYQRGMKARVVARDLHAGGGMLCYWTNRICAPWQDRKFLRDSRASLRPNQYLRMIENRWVTSESSFVEPEWWQACIDQQARPLVAAPALPVWVGVDASTKRDSTGIAVVTWDRSAGCVRLITHKIFQPSPKDPLDFEATIEKTLLELKQRFRVREVRYDPFAMQASSQRLARAGINMVEWAQSVPNITDASTCLFDLIRGGNLRVYPSGDLTLAIQRAVAVEVPRGWKISKASQSHKIDVVVALAMASLAAVEGGGQTLSGFQGIKDLDIAKRAVAAGTPVAQAAQAVGLSSDEVIRWIDRRAGGATTPMALRLARPPRGLEEAYEHARKLCDAGTPIDDALRQASALHRCSMSRELLAAIIAKTNAPTAPSRPLFAPPGAAKVFG